MRTRRAAIPQARRAAPVGRRVASLFLIAVAGTASLATSQAGTYPIEMAAGAQGTFQLGPNRPIATVEFDVSVDGIDGVGPNRPGPIADLWPDVFVVEGPPKGHVRSWIVPQVALGTDDPDHGLGSSEARWEVPCHENECRRSFALIVEWRRAGADDEVTVDWTIGASVAPPAWSPGKESGGAARIEPAVEPGGVALTSEAVDAGRVRLDRERPAAAWRVTMRLGDGPLDVALPWPLFATGDVSSSRFDAGTGTKPGLSLSIGEEGAPDDERVTRVVPSTVTIEPFRDCVLGEICEVVYLVQVDWRGTQAAAAEIDWRLDLRVANLDGTAQPVTIDVEPLPLEAPDPSGSGAP